jgi:hypothetical protein
MFRSQYIPDFFVAEHYVLQNTTSWGSKDLGSEQIFPLSPRMIGAVYI